VQVAQLAGYVSEHSAYHHGEQSLTSTIVGLAQDFVGSNNINFLVPSGQFGTRLQVSSFLTKFLTTVITIRGPGDHVQLKDFDTVGFLPIIMGILQDFVGSNSINFLVLSGQFGTRLLASVSLLLQEAWEVA
jgi:hypothetical protein